MILNMFLSVFFKVKRVLILPLYVLKFCCPVLRQSFPNYTQLSYQITLFYKKNFDLLFSKILSMNFGESCPANSLKHYFFNLCVFLLCFAHMAYNGLAMRCSRFFNCIWFYNLTSNLQFIFYRSLKPAMAYTLLLYAGLC